MAGIVAEERDLANGRVCSMWVEDGKQIRANLLLWPGAFIDLHDHSYDHYARGHHGVWDAVDIPPDGVRREYVLHAPFQFLVPAWHKHSFTLREHDGRPGDITCWWPDK